MFNDVIDMVSRLSDGLTDYSIVIFWHAVFLGMLLLVGAMLFVAVSYLVYSVFMYFNGSHEDDLTSEEDLTSEDDDEVYLEGE